MTKANGVRLSTALEIRNKIISSLLALILGVSMFFILAPSVSASALDPIDANVVPVTITAGTESITSSIRAAAYVVGDQMFYGLDYDSVDEVYSLSGNPTSGTFAVVYEGTVSVNQQFSGLNSGSYYTYINGYKPVHLQFSVSNAQQSRVSLLDYNFESNIETNYATAQWTSNGINYSNVTAYFSCIQQNVPSYFQTVINLHYRLYSTFTWSGQENFTNRVMAALGTTPSVSIVNSSVNINCYQSEYNYTDIMQAIDLKLYSIFLASNSLFTMLQSELNETQSTLASMALRVNDFYARNHDDILNLGNVIATMSGTIGDKILDFYARNHNDIVNVGSDVNNIRSTLNSLYARNHTDLENIYNRNHTDLTNIYNLLNEERQGSHINDSIDSELAQAHSEEARMDAAIVSALPDADNQLDAILDYDYVSIHSDRIASFSFWKNLGDFILSNANLRGIGALLILILFLGLVVYLLRL